MLKNIVIAVLIVLAGFAAYVHFQPNEFSVTRSATFAASPEIVFQQINNLGNWKKWSPWAEMEPDQLVSYEGPVEGEGAVMSWQGKETGIGSMKITSSSPELVKMQLDFKKPMEAVGYVTFTFAEDAGNTKVTWTHAGSYDFMGKAINVVMGMEKILGEQFDKGFNNLRKIVEG